MSLNQHSKQKQQLKQSKQNTSDGKQRIEIFKHRGYRAELPICIKTKARGKRLHSDQPQSSKLNKNRKPSGSCVVSFWVLRLLHNTPQKFNIAPKKLPSPKKTDTLPTIFRGQQLKEGVQGLVKCIKCVLSMISHPTPENTYKYMSTWQRVWSIMSNQLLTIGTPTWQWSDNSGCGRRLRMTRIKSQ